MYIRTLLLLLNVVLHSFSAETNLPPVFTHEFTSLTLSESTPVGQVVNTLSGYDPEGNTVVFGVIGTDYFEVDPISGNMTLVKPLDRETLDTFSFFITIKDRIKDAEDSEDDNLVEVPVTVIVLDENDNEPKFENIPYEADIYENALKGTVVFNKILAVDVDSVGEILNVTCVPSFKNQEACSKFVLEVVESTQNILKANVLTNDVLDYNQQAIYYFKISVTDGLHSSQTSVEIRVKDIQNTPPLFQGSLAAIIDEDSPIGTLVLKVQAKDGDSGEPRKISYELLSNPMDYFVLDAKTGELRTAKPLDREALSNASGLINVSVRAKEVDSNNSEFDNLTSTVSQISITIKDVNDSPPEFDKKEYNVSIEENLVPGTPIGLEMTVTDKDVGDNAIFSLRLKDFSGIFQVEPEVVRGSSQVSLRMGNNKLDYENPNQRKFIILVIAEEIKTDPKLSSTATVTISVIDTNDNSPIFDQESYSAVVSESAQPGQYITTITAKDIDSDMYGSFGIRYTLSGPGSELFTVNSTSGTITLADCYWELNSSQIELDEMNNKTNTHDTSNDISDRLNAEYIILKDNELQQSESVFKRSMNNYQTQPNHTCLDYESRNIYFFSFKATDDNGRGHSTVVSLKISVTDANDSPPVCENPVYKAAVDEASFNFDLPLIIKARDPDLNSDITYSILGNEVVQKLFSIDKRSGQINVKENASLDVNDLKTDFVAFIVEVSDGKFFTNCLVNIMIRDVNNHAPQFLRNVYKISIPEDTERGTKVEHVQATDLDTNLNAEIKYFIQQGNFDDFRVDEISGEVFVSRKLDYDRRNIYEIEIIASDLGTPQLSGTTTLTIDILNINNKNPYFTPVTQYSEIREDVTPGTLIHKLMAVDPDTSDSNALQFAASEPITAINKNGKEVNVDSDLKDTFLVMKNGSVILKKKLRKKMFSTILITVQVTDITAATVQQGQGILVISIVEINEIPPKFFPPWTQNNSIVKFEIIEELPLGSILTTLQAYDEDSAIGSYSISENKYFIINETNGTITTKSRIDYEQIKEIRFHVTVSDTGIPELTSTADVIVDVVNINDNEPIFLLQEYALNVLENSAKGTLVGKIEAKDNDLGVFGEISYSLFGIHAKNFLLDSDTGIIMVANSSFFDHEKLTEVKLTAIATDKAPLLVQKSSTVPVSVVIVDVNDNPPIFLQNNYSAEVAENVPFNPPAVLLQVKAQDKDDGVFGEVRYLIVDGNDENLFEMDYVTGIFYPKQSLLGKHGKYYFNVEARDLAGAGPFKSLVSVTLNVFSVNQHHPVFIIPTADNAVIKLYKNVVEKDYLVMTIKAVDGDEGENGRISYHLQINNNSVQETDYFVINETTGELRTKTRLSRNEETQYNIVLIARDNGNPSPFQTLQILKIHLIDEHENRIQFPDRLNPYKMSVAENSLRGIKVGMVQAYSDSKTEIFYYILLGNENSAFYLNKSSGEIFTNKSLDREEIDSYTLYVLASSDPDRHISNTDKEEFLIKVLERDDAIAKVWITILDENDNAPLFVDDVYYAAINYKSARNEFVTAVNAIDKDFGENSTLDYIILGSNLYKFSSDKLTGLIVPNPFSISHDGKIMTSVFMAEYNQDRFELDVIAKEVKPPERLAKTKVYVWIFDSNQLIRIILSKSPTEVKKTVDKIVGELRNTTGKYILVDEIRFHVDYTGRVRMDWCDLYFHVIDQKSKQIVPVNDILQIIDMNYDYLKGYYADFGIENIVPAYVNATQEEFNFTLAALSALLVILFIGIVTFIVICCCLQHLNISTPVETYKKDVLIKKQIFEDLNTTENPLWVERKLKLYEEQELTMQVFSESDIVTNKVETLPIASNERISGGNVQATGENTYATITFRDDFQSTSIADYASLRNNRV